LTLIEEVQYRSKKEQTKFGSTMWTWGIGAREHTNFISENKTIREWKMALRDPVGNHQQAQAQIEGGEVVDSECGDGRR
jgi:hypothetical protein